MIRKIPYIITILTMTSGILISIMFGANEAFFKNKISLGLTKNIKINAIQDQKAKRAKIEKEKSKCWRYYQRFHFHATGISTMSLSLLIFLLFVSAPKRLKLITRYLISIGGFLYPFVWLFAAIYGPEWGRHEAKEAFAIFGYMGGLFLVGAFLTIYMTIRYDINFYNFDESN